MRERAKALGYAALRGAAAFFLALLLTVLLIKANHGNVRDALSAMWDGAFGGHVLCDSYTLLGRFHVLVPAHVTFDGNALGNTIVHMGPLVLTGLGLAIAFRARMWNIGGQGQFLVGAILASYLATNFPLTHELPQFALLPVMMIGGAVAGGAWAAIPALLKVLRNVPEVISTIMLNFVAIYLLSYLVNGPLQRADHSQPATEELGANATLPLLFHQSSVHAGLLIVALIAVVVWLMLHYTSTGFSIRAVGASPEAARLAGHSVEMTTITAMLWSGALCGLAGAIELSGVIGNLPEGYAPEYGFTAVAVALLGRLEVGGVIASALLFGALSSGSENMERTAGIAHELGFVVQATLLLVLLAAPGIKWPRDWPFQRRSVVRETPS
jgi:ABC-type uncharacterized transport system permease subunit